jgi:hypothetical protein
MLCDDSKDVASNFARGASLYSERTLLQDFLTPRVLSLQDSKAFNRVYADIGVLHLLMPLFDAGIFSFIYPVRTLANPSKAKSQPWSMNAQTRLWIRVSSLLKLMRQVKWKSLFGATVSNFEIAHCPGLPRSSAARN